MLSTVKVFYADSLKFYLSLGGSNAGMDGMDSGVLGGTLDAAEAFLSALDELASQVNQASHSALASAAMKVWTRLQKIPAAQLESVLLLLPWNRVILFVSLVHEWLLGQAELFTTSSNSTSSTSCSSPRSLSACVLLTRAMSLLCRIHSSAFINSSSLTVTFGSSSSGCGAVGITLTTLLVAIGKELRSLLAGHRNILAFNRSALALCLSEWKARHSIIMD